ncbi:LpxL/LpxP family acyltransferase [Kaarinaea lacus]
MAATKQWQQQKERGSAFLIKFMRWSALNLGRTPTRLILPPIVLYFMLAASKARQASKRYLKRVLNRQPTLWNIANHFYYFAATILDRVFFVIGNYQLFDTRIYNPEVLLDRVEQGQGCILMGAHLGSFEALRAMGITHKQLPIKVLMYKRPGEWIMKLLDALNPQIADSVIPLYQPNTLLVASEFVAQGGVLGMLADRVDNESKTVQCNFLGAPTVFPSGPIALAATFKVPVILIFGLYRGGKRYDLHFELFAEKITLSRENREQEMQQWMQQYADRLAHYAGKAPYNWFNFYDYWHEYS